MDQSTAKMPQTGLCIATFTEVRQVPGKVTCFLCDLFINACVKYYCLGKPALLFRVERSITPGFINVVFNYQLKTKLNVDN